MVGLEILVVDIGIQYSLLHHQSITNKGTAKCFDQEKQTKTHYIQYSQSTVQSGDIDDIDCCKHTRIWSYIGAILHVQCVMCKPTTFAPIFHPPKQSVCERNLLA